MRSKQKYYLAPQMEAYDRLGWTWRPYIMFSQCANFTSSFVNTDSNGFRHSYDKNNKLINHNIINEANILIGGSTAFGVGATSDLHTIPSLLNKNTNETWLNFGGRAYTSAQELMLFLFYHHNISKINKIVIFSGMNDLTIFYMSKYFNKNFGGFFFGNKFYESMSHNGRIRDLILRPIIIPFLKQIYGNFNFQKLSLNALLNLFMKKKDINDFRHIMNENEIIYDHESEIQILPKILKNNLKNWKIFSMNYNAKLIYVLQPFADWLNSREIAEEENVLFKILNKKQGKTWEMLSNKLRKKHEFFSTEISKICTEFDIKFYDSNVYLNSPQFSHKHLFVDRVHLTDLGYSIMANYIKDLL